jgi:large subunit ribosomal protein L31
MQKNMHPNYQEVLFIDTSTGIKFICGSSLKTDETEEFNGKEYPVLRVAVSAHSHPLYTGSGGHVDSEGRVSRFKKRYGGSQK